MYGNNKLSFDKRSWDEKEPDYMKIGRSNTYMQMDKEEYWIGHVISDEMAMMCNQTTMEMRIVPMASTIPEETAKAINEHPEFAGRFCATERDKGEWAPFLKYNLTDRVKILRYTFSSYCICVMVINNSKIKVFVYPLRFQYWRFYVCPRWSAAPDYWLQKHGATVWLVKYTLWFDAQHENAYTHKMNLINTHLITTENFDDFAYSILKETIAKEKERKKTLLLEKMDNDRKKRCNNIGSGYMMAHTSKLCFDKMIRIALPKIISQESAFQGFFAYDQGSGFKNSFMFRY
jgi:hypothetical protein